MAWFSFLPLDLGGNRYTMQACMGATLLMSRINRVTTETGDQGTTSLATGRRVSKTAPIITALGSVDELSSLLGVLRNQARRHWPPS